MVNFIPNLDLIKTSLLVLFNVDVDWEMGVDVSHLVLITLCDADDEVSDDGLDSAESSDIFAAAVVDLDRDNIFLGKGEADGKVGEVFCQFAWRIMSYQQSRIPMAWIPSRGCLVSWIGFMQAMVSALKGREAYLVGLLP